MGQRYLSLDFLRGLTIFGMVFSALEPAGVLPAWMYHVQNPPPTHALDMSVAGIGWVDLVFPVFIFCMGVAIPLAGRGKTASSARNFVKETFSRFGMLWLFSYLYVFLNFSNNRIDEVPVAGIWPQVATLLGFASLFPIYLVIKRKGSVVKWVRIAGIVMACLLIAAGHFLWGEVLSVQRRGIIIFLLAFLYLFGALGWYFTRDNLRKRALLFGGILLFTVFTQWAGWPVSCYANPHLRWWFNVEYIYFLLLLLPATFVGDVLHRKMAAGASLCAEVSGKTAHWFFPSLFLFTGWLCYAFYMRLYWENLLVSGVFAAVCGGMVFRKFPQYRKMFLLAMGLILCGVITDPLGGGIRKVPCTVSYCFATGGMSILLLMVSDYVCRYLSGSMVVRVFVGAGKNPLMSYVAFDNFVLPLMKATGAIILYQTAYPAGVWLAGVLRAAGITFLTMWLVSLFSNKKIFWKA